MSYPYDANPWDDNPPYQQQQTGGYGSGGYSAGGYSNPMAQYDTTTTDQPQSHQYLYGDQDQSQYQAQEAGRQDGQQPEQPQQSFLRRFIGQRIPVCGTIMDTMSRVNLPFLDKLVQHVNRDLLVSKMFYFFFYSAFGSLFPLMGVYFKQLGMNPAQVGILTGVRPFIEIFSAPFWHSLAERFHKSKALLLFSVLSWIVFTYSLAHIRPPASSCIAFNDTGFILYTPYSANELSNYEVSQMEEAGESSSSDPATSSSSKGGNEMFLSKMPQSLESREGKDQILASEENQNDQRRRRRRDTVLADEDLDLDLENDFDDQSLTANEQHFRHRRSMKDVDDLLGESDEPEPEEETEQSDEQTGDKTQNRAKNKESGQSNEEGEEEERAGEDDAISDDKQTKTKQQHGQQKTVTSSTTTTTTTSTTAKTPTEGITYETNQSQENGSVKKAKRIYKQRHKTPPTHIVGMSPITVEYAINYDKEKNSQFVTPMFSTIVYKLDDIKEVFFLLLLLISLGEFFSAPALTLADSATLGYLGENTDLYGRQRMFGSLSWAITLLLVGMALDNATSIADHPCGPHMRERSYTVCFVIFSLLMACAFLTATQFRFNYPKGSGEAANGATGQNLITSSTGENNGSVVTTTAGDASVGNIDQLYATTQPRSIFNTGPPVNAPPPNAQQGDGKEKFEFLDKWKSAVFAQRTWEVPEWVNVFRQFKNSLHLTYLFITWFLGCGVGLVFTFLFWHLQDVGGTPTLFGICSVINHISEILAYFFSFSFIKRFGHTKVSSNQFIIINIII